MSSIGHFPDDNIAWQVVRVLDKEPQNLKARIVRDATRGVHRSTMFTLSFQIDGLMDEDGRALVAGEELEEILYDWCRRGVKNALEQGRAKIPNHP